MRPAEGRIAGPWEPDHAGDLIRKELATGDLVACIFDDGRWVVYRARDEGDGKMCGSIAAEGEPRGVGSAFVNCAAVLRARGWRLVAAMEAP